MQAIYPLAASRLGRGLQLGNAHGMGRSCRTYPARRYLMWAGAIAWQIGYDTVYAYVDVRDDTRLGLKSTAILFGRHGKIYIGLLYALAIGAWSLGGWLLDMSPPYAIGMLVIASHLGWQTWKIDLARPELNYRLFVANILTGVLLAGAAVIGTL